MTLVKEYLDERGRSPFGTWFCDLDSTTAARVSVAIARLETGNDSQAIPIGGSLYELRIMTGAGYRVYFGRDGDTWIILLGGGSKQRQQDDIQRAKNAWKAYLQRKKG